MTMRTASNRVAATVLAVAACLAASPSVAATFVLDGLSFVFFEGQEVGAGLPAGGKVEWEVEKAGDGLYTIRIPEDSLEFAPMTYPSGKTVQWKLSGPGTGTLSQQNSGLSCEIDAPLVAYVDGSAEPVLFPLHFTTENAERSAQGFVAKRDGVRLDAETGYLQLVATGVSPTGADTAPGKPFYVVLSGTVTGLPQEVRSD